MAEVAVGHAVAPATRGAHGRDKLHVLDCPECQLLAVIPPRVVHELTKQLNRGLGAVLLHLCFRVRVVRLCFQFS